MVARGHRESASPNSSPRGRESSGPGQLDAGCGRGWPFLQGAPWISSSFEGCTESALGWSASAGCSSMIPQTALSLMTCKASPEPATRKLRFLCLWLKSRSITAADSNGPGELSSRLVLLGRARRARLCPLDLERTRNPKSFSRLAL